MVWGENPLTAVNKTVRRLILLLEQKYITLNITTNVLDLTLFCAVHKIMSYMSEVKKCITFLKWSSVSYCTSLFSKCRFFIFSNISCQQQDHLIKNKNIKTLRICVWVNTKQQISSVELLWRNTLITKIQLNLVYDVQSIIMWRDIACSGRCIKITVFGMWCRVFW
jgi:hypothetical protein